MIGVAAIDHVQITVDAAHMDATLVFYENVIGLKRIAKSNSRTGAWFEVDGSAGGGTSHAPNAGFQLHVGGEDAARREELLESKRHVCFRVSDLAAAERAMREANVEIIDDKDPAAGWSRFYVRDPGGNRVEIAQRI